MHSRGQEKRRATVWEPVSVERKALWSGRLCGAKVILCLKRGPSDK